MRTISPSIYHGAAATLVHDFITSRLDHCCSVLVGIYTSDADCHAR